MPTSWTCCGPGPARTRRWTASSWTTRRGSMASTGRRAAMEQVDCVVIGAGVVGLAIARALAKAGREVLILESEGAFGTHTSARNSEVIHAGLSYAPGSLKALLRLDAGGPAAIEVGEGPVEPFGGRDRKRAGGAA